MAAQAEDAPPAAPGLRIDDRYCLDQIRAEHTPADGVSTTLWRAIDTALDRNVALLLVTGLNRTRHKAVVAAATRASQVPDGRFVRILDVGTADLAAGRTTWMATEWVEAPPLTAAVRDEPLAPAVATEVVRQCAEALAVAEQHGCRHGWLHPDQVLLPASGLPRITGLEVAAALHNDEGGDDTRSLGGLLFAALTGRWPLSGRTGLPGVDERVAHDPRPRLIRGGLSRDVDDVAHAMLVGRHPDARSCARALGALPTRPLDAPPATAATGEQTALNRWAWRVVPPLAVLAIGLAGWAIGSELGRVPTEARQHHAALPPAHASAPGAGRLHLVWRSPPAVTSFDPEGDGQEDDDAAPLAVDRDPTTVWTTDLYKNDSHLGGLKSGVGLLVDLGRPRSVRVAELALSRAGSNVEIRAGDDPPQQPSDLRLIDTRNQAPARTRMTLQAPERARYWLVWFTNLPPDGGGYRIGVAEVALLG